MNDKELNIKKIHKSDLFYLQIAYKIAQKSNMQHKHGCIIVDNKSNIISTGYNKLLTIRNNKIKIYKKDTDIKLSKHAEEMALRNVDPKKLYGAKLYITRINFINNNLENNITFLPETDLIKNFSFSKPCKRCTSIINSCIKKCGLKTIYYT
jgi:deoxycytidylate deaminase